MGTLTRDQCPAGKEAKSDQDHQRSERDELRAALEYRLGLEPDVYAIADVVETTAEALFSRGRPLDAATGTRKNGISGDLPATNGGASVPEHGRRRLDDALLLLAMIIDSEHPTQVADS